MWDSTGDVPLSYCNINVNVSQYTKIQQPAGQSVSLDERELLLAYELTTSNIQSINSK